MGTFIKAGLSRGATQPNDFIFSNLIRVLTYYRDISGQKLILILFFPYYKVKHVCAVAEEMQRMGKCVVIGLQSTGEARTLEAVEVKQKVLENKLLLPIMGNSIYIQTVFLMMNMNPEANKFFQAPK